MAASSAARKPLAKVIEMHWRHDVSSSIRKPEPQRDQAFSARSFQLGHQPIAESVPQALTENLHILFQFSV
ncbi:hypothetical protein NO932_06315 [Pelagibacterium sp. 26DY04]|uniref:hypothetical protein n=1 Tax=Pelagibacterium sp. 26DY04 TaxID=2967130 RepID=UPI002815FF69|nr:hypothetical protein [Pelagibacterium sp. 26DY04]WMT88220.1 hypothetical protein NO932_06315 [Pelagibacterium sp. 26DY04]